MTKYPKKPPSEKDKKKIGKYLAEGEEIVLATGISNRYFLLHFFPFFLLSFIFLGLPKLGNLVRRKQSYKYVLTNRRFMIISGIFSRKLTTAPLDRITHVTVEQSFPERFLFNSGQLVIITAGFDKREIVIENIGDPIKFKILMEELITKIDKGEVEEKKVESKERKEVPKTAPFKLRPLRI